MRLRADASMYSKSGGSIQLRGIGAKSFLDAKNLRLVQPIQIRFKQAGANKVLFPNQFLDAFSQGSGVQGQNTYAAGESNKLAWRTQTNPATTDVFNGITTVTNGLFKSMSNLVLSINGSSWQQRPSSMIDSFDKIPFCYNPERK